MADDLPNASGYPRRIRRLERRLEWVRERAVKGFSPTSTSRDLAEASALESALDAMRYVQRQNGRQGDDARDAEWQQRLMELHEGFDGDGCESGDPIDWSVSALSQAQASLVDRADELEKALDAACLIASQRNAQWARAAGEDAIGEDAEDVERSERRTDEQLAHLRAVARGDQPFDEEKVR